MPDGVGALADRIATLVCATLCVAGLHTGMFGEVGTYLPGRRVTGVRVADGTVDVHLIVDAGAPLGSTAAAVRAAVAAAVPGRRSTSRSRTSMSAPDDRDRAARRRAAFRRHHPDAGGTAAELAAALAAFDDRPAARVTVAPTMRGRLRRFLRRARRRRGRTSRRLR